MFSYESHNVYLGFSHFLEQFLKDASRAVFRSFPLICTRKDASLGCKSNAETKLASLSGRGSCSRGSIDGPRDLLFIDGAVGVGMDRPRRQPLGRAFRVRGLHARPAQRL